MWKKGTLLCSIILGLALHAKLLLPRCCLAYLFFSPRERNVGECMQWVTCCTVMHCAAPPLCTLQAVVSDRCHNKTEEMARI